MRALFLLLFLALPAAAQSGGFAPLARAGGGASFGLLDTRYLKLDGSNSPMTGQLKLHYTSLPTCADYALDLDGNGLQTIGMPHADNSIDICANGVSQLKIWHKGIIIRNTGYDTTYPSIMWDGSTAGITRHNGNAASWLSAGAALTWDTIDGAGGYAGLFAEAADMYYLGAPMYPWSEIFAGALTIKSGGGDGIVQIGADGGPDDSNLSWLIMAKQLARDGVQMTGVVQLPVVVENGGYLHTMPKPFACSSSKVGAMFLGDAPGKPTVVCVCAKDSSNVYSWQAWVFSDPGTGATCPGV